MKPASTKQQAPSRNPASCLLPPAHYSRGFALLVAVVFMSVMLAFGLALASLAYKQQVLASSAILSQYAFYAADAGLECALYADQKQALFSPFPTTTPPVPVPKITCDGVEANSANTVQHDADGWWIIEEQLSLDDNKRCADITIYRASPTSGFPNYIFSQGYDVSCAVVADPGNARFVARGINVRF